MEVDIETKNNSSEEKESTSNQIYIGICFITARL